MNIVLEKAADLAIPTVMSFSNVEKDCFLGTTLFLLFFLRNCG